MSCMKCFSKCPYSKKLVMPWKIFGCAPVTFTLAFYPNFLPNIWNFPNLPIDRKLIHGNINLVIWKPRTFCLVLFWMRYNIGCTYKYMHYKLRLMLFFKTIKIFFLPTYLRCCKIPKRYGSNSSNSSD